MVVVNPLFVMVVVNLCLEIIGLYAYKRKFVSLNIILYKKIYLII